MVAALACGLAALVAGMDTDAATVNWIAPATDVYTNTAAWSTGSLPGSGDVAAIGNGTTAIGSVLYTNAPPDPAATNALNSLLLANAASANGSFTMNAGTLSITNTGASGLLVGDAVGATASFTMNGGVLNVVRNASTFFQDCFQLGLSTSSTGTFTLNNGTANFICGIELGTGGAGIINVAGGTLIDNGWFGVGRGNGAATGSGTFNLSGGTVYLLRNPGTDGSGAISGVGFCQQGTNATVNITGGTLYCNLFRFQAGPGAGKTDWETFNFSAGDIYIGSGGMHDNAANGTHNLAITLSGGTFHTVDMEANTGGTLGLASILPGGTNWSWDATLPATLNTSPGSGVVTFIPDAGRTITLNNNFSGPGGIAMPGPGTLAINGVNSYTGPTTISGGTLAGSGTVGGSTTISPGVTIAPGAGSTPGTLTFASGLSLDSVTNKIKLSNDPFTVGGGVNDLIVVNGNLSLQNLSTIKIIALNPLSTDAPYTILQYTGTPLTSADLAHLQLVSDNPRFSLSFVDPSTTPGSIQIAVSGNPANLVWRGGDPSNPTAWDNVTSNWFNTGTSSMDQFFNGDAVTFDDTAITNVVNIPAQVRTTSVTLMNSSVAYTFTGAGPVIGPLAMEGTGALTLALSNAPGFTAVTSDSGTLVFDIQNPGSYALTAPFSDNQLGQSTIVKTGTNTMVLSADNTFFTGTMIVSNGVMQYTNAISLGAAPSPLYVTNNGSVDLNGIVAGLKNFIIAGNGFNGQGAIFDNSGKGLINNNGINNLTLSGDAAIGAVNRWDVYQNMLNGNGFKLTEVGPGSNIFADDGETSLGDIHVVAGRLGFQGSVTMGDPAKTVTVESNATLTFFSAVNNGTTNGGETKTLVLNGHAILDSGGSSNNLNGPVFLSGTNLIGTRSTLHLWGNISDGATPGGFVLGKDQVGNSGGDLWIDGVNSYTGPTIITNRTLYVGPGSSLGASSFVLVAAPGKLDVSSQGTFTFGSGQTLVGNGTVAANDLVFASGSALAAGIPGDTNTYTFVMNAAVTLSSGSTNVVVVNKNGAIANSEITGLSSMNFGGTLVVLNVGAPLAGGDAIQIASSLGGYTGAYDAIFPATPGDGLLWDTSTLDTDGMLRVLGTGPDANPTNIVVSVSANQLTLSWPTNHTGWTLQAQTNGLTGPWFTVPGSTTTNQVTMPVDPANGSVFYRMILNP